MRFLGNVLWLLLGGIILTVLWFVFGLLWCCTIVGIPIGVQCFKCAGLSFAPFGRDIEYSSSVFSLLVNILWIFIGGVEIAAFCLGIGLVFCVTIVGIPFGLQYFKFAKLALMPFGARIVRV